MILLLSATILEFACPEVQYIAKESCIVPMQDAQFPGCGDIIISINGMNVEGATADDVRQMMRSEDKIKPNVDGDGDYVTIGFLRFENIMPAKDRKDRVAFEGSDASISLGNLQKSESFPSTTYVGVQWITAPGDHNWVATLTIGDESRGSDSIGDDDSEDEESSFSQHVSFLGVYDSEIVAARVHDEAARMQYGDSSLLMGLLNFMASTNDEKRREDSAARDTIHWAQCDLCNKWRALSTEWTLSQFHCSDIQSCCADEEDSASSNPSSLIRKRLALKRLGSRGWMRQLSQRVA